MSEAEFDSYLSLLSKFLRLRSHQRAELADELRDHLETRLDELVSEGKDREQAIRIALEEFGDAALLAEEFSHLASRRKRRFVMRCTAASAAVVAAVVLLSIAFAPPGPVGPGPQQVIAQQDPAQAESQPESAGNDAPRDESSLEQQAMAALEDKLGQPVPEVTFLEVPLNEALEAVADAIQADVLIDRSSLVDEGLEPEAPVTLVLQRTPASARTVLTFLLEPLDMTFVNRAGVIYVTTASEAEAYLTTRVYNVRDLLEDATPHGTSQPTFIGGGFGGGMGGGDAGGGGLGGGGVGGGGFFSIPTHAALALSAAAPGQFGSGEGGMGGLPPSPPPTAADELLTTIQQTTSGPWMEIDGQGGTMSLFDGLLVVRQTDPVHTQIQELLDALREADRRQPGDSVTVPKDTDRSRTDSSSTKSDTAKAMPPMRGLGPKFADYRPTPEMRQLFLGTLQHVDSGNDIGQHLLLSTLLTIPGPAQSVFQHAGIYTEEMERARVQFGRDEPIGELYAFLDDAQQLAKKDGLESFDSGHLLTALLEKEGGDGVREILALLGLNPQQLKDRIAEYRKAIADEPQRRNPLQSAPDARR